MSLNNQLQPLMQKEMSRKEFLVTLGFGIASIFGFSTIIHLLTGKSVESHFKQDLNKEGYSSNDYGN
jgi:hypothetical protein